MIVPATPRNDAATAALAAASALARTCGTLNPNDRGAGGPALGGPGRVGGAGGGVGGAGGGVGGREGVERDMQEVP